MHEQALPAKLRRTWIALLARVLPPAWTATLARSPAEQAAIALRRAAKTAPDAPPTTTFAIPLVGAHQVGDWQVIEETLTRCLQALIAQTDGRWRAVICSQTRPAACDLDPRISHLAFSQTVDGHDKVPKLQALARQCCETDRISGFFMPLDGDDLLHSGFVRALHEDPATGLLVSHGLIANAATGEVARTTPRHSGALGQKPFWKFCGSCMALPIGRSWPEEQAFVSALALHEHRLYPYLADLAGIKLIHSDTPLALYMINHGENFETRRGRGGFKQRFTHKFALGADEKRAALAGFAQASGALSSRTTDP